MPKTKIEEVYDFLLPEIEALGLGVDTNDPSIRISALQGLLDGWTEDVSDDYHPDKIFWILAVQAEIFGLNMKLQFPNLK